MRDASIGMWRFWIDKPEIFGPIFQRKKRPHIGEIIEHRGKKWSVWYIEEGPGALNARLEPVV